MRAVVGVTVYSGVVVGVTVYSGVVVGVTVYSGEGGRCDRLQLGQWSV